MKTWLIIFSVVAVLLAASTGVGFWMRTSTQANEPPVVYDLSNSINATISDGQGMGTILDNGLVRWGEYGHYYYLYYGTQIYRTYAADQCASRGMLLASINDISEHAFINNFRISNDPNAWLWFGLSRVHDTAPWLFDSGEDFCPNGPGTPGCWWGFWEDEGSEQTLEHFAYMATWGDNTFGYWGSAGNGLKVYAQCYACEKPDPPPTAYAGQDQSVTYGTLVTLDGGDSTDPDDDYPLAFSWDISSAPNGSTVALDDSSNVTPCFTPDLLGTYVITLVVDDSYGVSSDPDQVIVTVEEPLPTLSINDISENEDVGVADFTVMLSSPSSFPVTVNYSTADGTATAGSDYTATSGTQTFAPGEIDKTISVPIVDDFLYEGDETFSLNLSNSINATISDGQGIGTIVDNDLPGYPVGLTISSTAGGNVTTPGEGTFAYDEGMVVDLVATPNTSYRFVNWTGDVGTIDNVNAAATNITMGGNYSISANFAVATECFIATAAYGTPMADGVQILREFRDGYLLTNPLGQAFVHFYYKFSPPIAEFITNHPSLKPIVRTALVPAVVISAVVVNSTPVEKIAIFGLLAFVSVVVGMRMTRRQGKDTQHA